MIATLSAHQKFPLLEEETLRYWKTHRIFEKVAELRRGGMPYRAIPQPPQTVHSPGLQPTVEFAFQDLTLRYKAMRGYSISWLLSWSAHGLSVELGAEARLGLSGARQIAAYGLGRFHELCHRSAFDYLLDWQRLVERLGLWADWEQVPVNLTNDQIEKSWQVFKTLSEGDNLVQETKVVPYCPRCATAQGSPTGCLPETLADQHSMFIRLPLVEDPGTSLLVWTDQPWSLPGNIAVGANPEIEYVIVERELLEHGGGIEKLILAAQSASKIFKDLPIRTFETFRGTRLKGLCYQPLFTYLLPDKPAYQVLLTETVPLEPGTGLRQLSPRFDEKARQIAQAHNLPVLPAIASDGSFVSEIRPWRGLSLRQAAPLIAQDLQQRGLVLNNVEIADQILPACPACGSALIDYVSPIWKIRTTASHQRLDLLARGMEWRPVLAQAEAGSAGLVANADWLVSRERSWGAPIPVWECRGCHHQQVVGSLAELAELAKEDLSGLDLHRPALDAIELPCPECDEQMQRLLEVLDTWFEQGVLGINDSSQPVSEAVDLLCTTYGQPQDWLAALHSISGLINDRAASQRALILPAVNKKVDEDRYYLSNLQGQNLTPLALMRDQSADALRWTLYLQPLTEPLMITSEFVNQVGGRLLRALWDLGELLTSRVDLHQLRLHRFEALPISTNQTARLDAWLCSRLHSLIRDVTTALETAEVRSAAVTLQEFILADLTGWYVPLRLEARRDEMFQPQDYLVFFETMATLSRLLAPALPFIGEHLYQSLERGPGLDGRESVHMTNWPTFEESAIQIDLEAEMTAVRHLVDLGMQARQQASLPLHQPLAEAAFALKYPAAAQLVETNALLLCQKLNVRQVRLLDPADETEILADERHTWTIVSSGDNIAALALRLTPELISEGLAGEFIMRVIELRKKADLPPHDPVRIVYMATTRLAEAIETHQTRILAETQAVELSPFGESSPPRLSETTKRLFTITEFHNEKTTFGIERI